MSKVVHFEIPIDDPDRAAGPSIGDPGGGVRDPRSSTGCGRHQRARRHTLAARPTVRGHGRTGAAPASA